MKKFFSLLILVALFAALMILVACEKTPIVVPGPDDQTPHEHSYSKKEYKATCSAEGYTEYTCRDCGHTYRGSFVAIDPRNHMMYDENGKLVTANKETRYSPKNCLEEGYVVTHCLACGVRTTSSTGIGSHNWNKTHPIEIVEPTCEKDGYFKYNCSLCGKENQDTMRSSGHLWNEWEIDVPALCDGNHSSYGSQHRTCKVCELRQDEVIIPHHGETVKEIVPPTCTSVGYTVYVCDGCGIDFVREYRDALGHKWTVWHDCEIGPEFETRECPVCGLSEIRVKAITD